MEPSAPTVTEARADEFRRVVNALPPADRIEPQENELVENPDVGYVRLQDRKRAWTTSQAMGCIFTVYLSFRKKRNSWAIGFTHREHNHPMNPAPFSYIIHRPRRVGQGKAVELARGLRGEVSYKKATRILKNHDVHIERREFYNLTRTENLKKLKQAEELPLLLSILDNEDFRVRVQEQYNHNDLESIGERISQVLQNLFFCNSEQIRLARRFVSTFIYETDATFDTNELRLRCHRFAIVVGT